MYFDDSFGPYNYIGSGISFISTDFTWERKKTLNMLQLEYWHSNMKNTLKHLPGLMNRNLSFQFEKLWKLKSETPFSLAYGTGLSTRLGIRSNLIDYQLLRGELIQSIDLSINPKIKFNNITNIDFKLKVPVLLFMIFNNIGVGNVLFRFGTFNKLKLINGSFQYNQNLSDKIIWNAGLSFQYSNYQYKGAITKSTNDIYFSGLKIIF
jgi:hypothetical protein